MTLALPFDAATFAARRRALAEAVGDGLIVLLGNDDAPMNYAGNAYAFRQDGAFRYYGGMDEPGLALAIDAETGRTMLYGADPTMDDVVWEGPRPSLAERAAAIGADEAAPRERLADAVGQARSLDRRVHVLPPYRGAHRLTLGRLLGVPPDAVAPSAALIEAVIAQRIIKTDAEVAELERALELTAHMHRMAMRHAQPGRTEREVAAAVEAVALARGRGVSFPVILTRRGEVLHNHPTDYAFRAGDLLLCDAGAVAPSGYAGDVTRTSPVGGRFSAQQRGVYEAVLAAQEAGIAACEPGVPYRDVHLHVARVLVDGLQGLGLLRGDAGEAVAAGAHALFMPHGLGHAIGLDVHDLEGLGEDHVGYDDEVRRSDQFGLAFLRFGRRLREGMVMTVEPGCYFIGPLIDQWRAEGRHGAFIDYDAVEAYRDFGGIRIEDDVVITAGGCRVLGPGIPKRPDEVEAEVALGADRATADA